MKVAGFTIARNIIKADYPLKEALLSILPMVDELVIAVGNSCDGTREYIESLNEPKIRIIDTIWDDNNRKGGAVLADETNKAKSHVSIDADWLFYIQADECIHEQFYPVVKASMEKYLNNEKVEGLLFDYQHFYGNYAMVGDSRRWYRNEIRIIRNRKDICSWKDAQGFRTTQGKKLNVAHSGGTMYHYGWVKHPAFQQQKQLQFHRLWHSDAHMKKNVKPLEVFDYSNIDSLQHFTGTHPAVMNTRISGIDWTFEMDPTRKNFGLKARFLYWVEKKFGWRPGEYKNYRLIP
ncbi:MAG: glycosyl transferase [Flavobacteriales bacterium]|nr:MAG: glycosyl transferase [Flavobacteriales bacterium]